MAPARYTCRGYAQSVLEERPFRALRGLPKQKTTELIDRLLEGDRPRAAFFAVQTDWGKVETSRLKRLLRAVATVDSEPADHFKIEAYTISEALKSLGGRPGVTPDEMVQLEFTFIGALRDSRERDSQPRTSASRSRRLCSCRCSLWSSGATTAGRTHRLGVLTIPPSLWRSWKCCACTPRTGQAYTRCKQRRPGRHRHRRTFAMGHRGAGPMQRTWPG